MDFRTSAITAPCDQFLLLAPSSEAVPSGLQTQVSPGRYRESLAEMQRLRGSIYLRDNAISSGALTRDGRHWESADAKSWHVLVLDDAGVVKGCARYRSYANSIPYHALGVRKSALAMNAGWGESLESAVEREIMRARDARVSYVEVGGWALSEELRWSAAALRIALGSYALAQMLGECVGISTVTFRNRSSSILRRIGGRSLEANGVELPPYHDPRYGCKMEILGFDSARPNPKYARLIDQIKRRLCAVPIICPTSVDPQVVPLPEFAEPRPADQAVN